MSHKTGRLFKTFKLTSVSHVEADGDGNKNISVYKKELAGNPNSCLIQIEKNRFRALIDSGAEISLIHKRVYQAFKNKPHLIKKQVYLQSVNGGTLEVEGYINMKFKIGKETITHPFYVVSELNRNVILGRDWLKDYGVRMYFDLEQGYQGQGQDYYQIGDNEDESTDESEGDEFEFDEFDELLANN